MQYHNLGPSVSATTADSQTSRQIRRSQVIQSQIAKELRSRFSYLTTRVGLILFAGGIGWAMKELVLSISPLEEESSHLHSFAAEQQNRANNREQNFIKAA